MIVGNPVARNYQSRAIVAAPAMHENRGPRRILQQRQDLCNLPILSLA
jgi:hypothetical protein